MTTEWKVTVNETASTTYLFECDASNEDEAMEAFHECDWRNLPKVAVDVRAWEVDEVIQTFEGR
jgi:hypothetical protein